jgi:isopenicillin N synthase-like dioxygenase
LTPSVVELRSLRPEEVRRALLEGGGFLLRGALDEALCRAVLAAARGFFALPAPEKAALGIARSPHFRGYSELHNERDFREQIHFGRELPAAGEAPAYQRLEGPNLWPPDPGFRGVILEYMRSAAEVGERVLASIAEGLGHEQGAFAGIAEDGYLLMKLIGYHPQRGGDAARPGVAAHVDFSWVTLTLEDGEGLSIRRPDGVWVDVALAPGAVWVHPGEILSFATSGLYDATPHRVVNRSTDRMRVSIPLFINPALSSTVASIPAPAPAPAPDFREHIHRVLRPSEAPLSLPFGEAEWRRKGLDGWCADCSVNRSRS